MKYVMFVCTDSERAAVLFGEAAALARSEPERRALVARAFRR